MRRTVRKTAWVVPVLGLLALGLEPGKLPGNLQQQLKQFGYGSERGAVYQPGDKESPVTLGGEGIDWLVLANRSERMVLLVLRNHDKTAARSRARLNLTKLGFSPEPEVQDGVTHKRIPLRRESVIAGLPGRPQAAEEYYLVDFILPPADHPVLVIVGKPPRR